MLHCMKLNRDPFEKIKSGSKTIEMRLFDEKRQRISVGDFIEFSSADNLPKKIQTRVTALHRFSSFEELYSAFPKEKKLGYSPADTADAHDMEEYYSLDKQKEYGVVGIELRMTDLQKYIDAQEKGYDFGEPYQTALSEIKNGRKITHWIWYVFPQIQGLGWSGITAYFSIRDIIEATDYYEHPVLGARLIEITEALYELNCYDLVSVLGLTDALKLRSCMTLFNRAIPQQQLFKKALDKYCQGMEDDKTLRALNLI